MEGRPNVVFVLFAGTVVCLEFDADVDFFGYAKPCERVEVGAPVGVVGVFVFAGVGVASGEVVEVEVFFIGVVCEFAGEVDVGFHVDDDAGDAEFCVSTDFAFSANGFTGARFTEAHHASGNFLCCEVDGFACVFVNSECYAGLFAFFAG